MGDGFGSLSEAGERHAADWARWTRVPGHDVYHGQLNWPALRELLSARDDGRSIVHVPAKARGGIASGGPVQRRDPGLRANDVADLVDIIAVVLVIERLRRELGQPVVVMARDQVRGGIRLQPGSTRHDRP